MEKRNLVHLMVFCFIYLDFCHSEFTFKITHETKTETKTKKPPKAKCKNKNKEVTFENNVEDTLPIKEAIENCQNMSMKVFEPRSMGDLKKFQKGIECTSYADKVFWTQIQIQGNDTTLLLKEIWLRNLLTKTINYRMELEENTFTSNFDGYVTLQFIDKKILADVRSAEKSYNYFCVNATKEKDNNLTTEEWSTSVPEPKNPPKTNWTNEIEEFPPEHYMFDKLPIKEAIENCQKMNRQVFEPKSLEDVQMFRETIECPSYAGKVFWTQIEIQGYGPSLWGKPWLFGLVTETNTYRTLNENIFAQNYVGYVALQFPDKIILADIRSGEESYNYFCVEKEEKDNDTATEDGSPSAPEPEKPPEAKCPKWIELKYKSDYFVKEKLPIKEAIENCQNGKKQVFEPQSLEEVNKFREFLECTSYKESLNKVYWTQIEIKGTENVSFWGKREWLRTLLTETPRLPEKNFKPKAKGYVVLQFLETKMIAHIQSAEESYPYSCVKNVTEETYYFSTEEWNTAVTLTTKELLTMETSTLPTNTPKMTTEEWNTSVTLTTKELPMETSTLPTNTLKMTTEEWNTSVTSTTEELSVETSTLPKGGNNKKIFCKGNKTTFDGFEINWPDTKLGEVAIADCPKGYYGDAYWNCDNETGQFIGVPQQNCTAINCSEPTGPEQSLMHIAESLTECGSSNDSVRTFDLLDKMRREKEKYRKEKDYEKDDTKMKKDVGTFIRVFDRLLEKDAVVWTKIKGEKRVRTSMEIIKETEETAWLMGCRDENMTMKRNNLAIEVFNLENESQTLAISLNSMDVGDVNLPSNLIAETAGLCDRQVQRGVVSAYRNVEDFLAPDSETMTEVGSGILGVSLGGQSNETFFLPGNKKIKVKLNHLQMQFGFAEPICVFLDWNYNKKKGKFGVWETEGCQMTDTGPYYTVCECNHLTNFAVLMNFAGQEPTGNNERILSLLSLVFGCLSIVALVMTIVIYATVKSFHNRRNTITCNLAVCLLAMNILVQTGLERVDTTVCKIVSSLLQYAVLSAFLWMLLEGVLLYRMIILVFEVNSFRLWVLYLIAYGIPVLIVAMSSAVRPGAMIRTNYCWPSQENGLIWSVTGPILLIITINVIIFGMTINAALKIKRLSNGPTDHKKKNLVQRLKGSISLMWLLGFSWAVGFFYVPNTHVAAYLFVILNGLQGVFLFLTQMVFNNPVRKKLFAIYKENMTKLTSPSGTWPFPLGKTSKGSSRTSGQDTSGTVSESCNVQPSAPPGSDMYTIQMRYFEREEKQPHHPFSVNP